MTPSFAIAVAVGTALTFAITEISLRNSLQSASLVTVSMLVLLVQSLVLTGFILFTGKFSEMRFPGIMWFALAGLGNPIFHMVFYFLGIQRIGIARSAPLKGSAPVFAVVFAFGILGERLALLQYFGIAMVVGGILVISTEGWSRIQAPSLSHSSKKDDLTSGSPNKLYYLFPVLAGLMGGIASTLFKISMSEMPSALLGVWIGSTEGLLLFPLIALLFPPRQRYQFSLAALRWAILAGVFASAAMYGLVLSIGMGQVSVVFTLAQTSPVFVIALSALFLRRVERVTLRVILGAVLTVGGGVLVGSY